MQSARDPRTITAIIDALGRVDGNSLACLTLIQGMTLGDLVTSLMRSPIKNGEAVKLVTQALESGDFVIEPEIVGPSHIAYVYDPPRSLHVVDIAIDTTQGRLASNEIRLRLRDPTVI